MLKGQVFVIQNKSKGYLGHDIIPFLIVIGISKSLGSKILISLDLGAVFTSTISELGSNSSN